MKRTFMQARLLFIVILSSSFLGAQDHDKSSAGASRLVPPQRPAGNPEQVAKSITADKALEAALKALADAKIRLFRRYKIVMNSPDNRSRWGVWFVALPETPGKDVYVSVASDGSTSILPGL